MTNCAECGVETIQARTWKRWTQAERDAAAAAGQACKSGRLCARCFMQAWRERSPRRPSTRTKLWKLEDLIDEAEFLFEAGTPVHSVASRLGLQQQSLSQAYYRARKKGLTTRRVPENRSRK